MKSPTKKHNTKNTKSHVSQNAQLVHLDNIHKIGASGANFFAKKKSIHNNINPTQT